VRNSRRFNTSSKSFENENVVYGLKKRIKKIDKSMAHVSCAGMR